MLLPDVLLADEDQVTRSEHAGATAPRASSCVSVRQPAALRPHPSSPLPLHTGPRQLELCRAQRDVSALASVERRSNDSVARAADPRSARGRRGPFGSSHAGGIEPLCWTTFRFYGGCSEKPR